MNTRSVEHLYFGRGQHCREGKVGIWTKVVSLFFGGRGEGRERASGAKCLGEGRVQLLKTL